MAFKTEVTDPEINHGCGDGFGLIGQGKFRHLKGRQMARLSNLTSLGFFIRNGYLYAEVSASPLPSTG